MSDFKTRTATMLSNASGVPVGFIGENGKEYLTSFSSLSSGTRSLVLIGDSRTVHALTVDANGTLFTNRGWLVWAFAHSAVYVPILANSSVVGRSVDQMIAALPTEVDPFNPTDVTIFGFVNSIGSYPTTTDAQIAAAYLAITTSLNTLYNYNIQKGRFCHIMLETANTSLTTNEKKVIPAVNRWIKQFCVARPESCYVYDFYSATVDPTSTVGNFLSSCTYDSIHMTTFGSYRCGKQTPTGFRSRFPPILLPQSLSEDKNINAQSKQLLKNPMLQGTGGSASSGCSGSVPTAFAVTSTNAGDTNVLSIVAASDGFGNAMRCANNTLGASRISFKSDDIVSVFAAGTQLYAVARVRIVASGQIKSLSVNFKIDSGTKVASAGYDMGSGTSPLVTGDQITLITPIVVPVSPASLRCEFYIEIGSADAAGIIEVERLGLIEV